MHHWIHRFLYARVIKVTWGALPDLQKLYFPQGHTQCHSVSPLGSKQMGCCDCLSFLLQDVYYPGEFSPLQIDYWRQMPCLWCLGFLGTYFIYCVRYRAQCRKYWAGLDMNNGCFRSGVCFIKKFCLLSDFRNSILYFLRNIDCFGSGYHGSFMITVRLLLGSQPPALPTYLPS